MVQTEVTSLKVGQVFTKRTILAQSMTECLVAVLTRSNFMKVITAIQRRYINKEVNFLKQSKYIGCLRKSSLIKIAQWLSPKTVIKGAYLYREEQPIKDIYIVVSGEIEIVQSVAQRKQLIESGHVTDSNWYHRQEVLNYIYKAPKGLKKKGKPLYLAGQLMPLAFDDALSDILETFLPIKKLLDVDKD